MAPETEAIAAQHDRAADQCQVAMPPGDEKLNALRSVSHGGSSTPSSPKSVIMQWLRASARALIAGYVDAYALLKFGVYASFMTGNTTSAGSFAGQHNFHQAAHSLLPIPCFLLGILLGTLLARTYERQDRGLARNSALGAAVLGAATPV